MNKEKVQSALLGLAIGDALGVPVEFEDRDDLKQNPVTGMTAGGEHDQPAGTFSDDSSMAFCLAENIAEGFSISGIADNFVKWYKENYWTARGQLFDIGIATQEALERIINGTNPVEAGGISENSNGNGSLMRILPLLFYIYEKPIEERFATTKDVSAITHGHIRSVISCFYYLEFARHILLGKNFDEAFSVLQTEIPDFLKSISISSEEISKLERLFAADFKNIPENEIHSSGYVIHTLEASIWCLLNTDNYKEAVLKAVNLGNDTDTTACVAGGLAGLKYGLENIPVNWLEELARKEDILDLGERLTLKIK